MPVALFFNWSYNLRKIVKILVGSTCRHNYKSPNPKISFQSNIWLWWRLEIISKVELHVPFMSLIWQAYLIDRVIIILISFNCGGWFSDYSCMKDVVGYGLVPLDGQTHVRPLRLCHFWVPIFVAPYHSLHVRDITFPLPFHLYIHIWLEGS